MKASSYCLPWSPPGRDRSQRERPPEEEGRQVTMKFVPGINLFLFQRGPDEVGRAQHEMRFPLRYLKAAEVKSPTV